MWETMKSEKENRLNDRESMNYTKCVIYHGNMWEMINNLRSNNMRDWSFYHNCFNTTCSVECATNLCWFFRSFCFLYFQFILFFHYFSNAGYSPYRFIWTFSLSKKRWTSCLMAIESKTYWVFHFHMQGQMLIWIPYYKLLDDRTVINVHTHTQTLYKLSNHPYTQMHAIQTIW